MWDILYRRPLRCPVASFHHDCFLDTGFGINDFKGPCQVLWPSSLPQPKEKAKEHQWRSCELYLVCDFLRLDMKDAYALVSPKLEDEVIVSWMTLHVYLAMDGQVASLESQWPMWNVQDVQEDYHGMTGRGQGGQTSVKNAGGYQDTAAAMNGRLQDPCVMAAGHMPQNCSCQWPQHQLYLYWHQSLSVLIPFLSPNAVIGRFGKYSIMIGWEIWREFKTCQS